MNIEKCEAFRSEGGGLYRTQEDAIRATFRERLDSWASIHLNHIPEWTKAYDVLYRNLDDIAGILQGYPPRFKKS